MRSAVLLIIRFCSIGKMVGKGPFGVTAIVGIGISAIGENRYTYGGNVKPLNVNLFVNS